MQLSVCLRMFVPSAMLNSQTSQDVKAVYNREVVVVCRVADRELSHGRRRLPLDVANPLARAVSGLACPIAVGVESAAGAAPDLAAAARMHRIATWETKAQTQYVLGRGRIHRARAPIGDGEHGCAGTGDVGHDNQDQEKGCRRHFIKLPKRGCTEYRATAMGNI